MTMTIVSLIPNEPFHENKNIVRTYLRAKGWRRDGRCKKWETYKLKRNGETYQVKFHRFAITFDLFRPPSFQGDRGTWSPIRSIRFTNIQDDNAMEFLLSRLPEESNFEATSEDVDNDNYLQRIGAIA